MVKTAPVQSKKQQPPKPTRYLPSDPASSKGMPVQARFSTPPVTEKWRNNATEPTSPHFPSPVPPSAENETFMFATRHALEQALGKKNLDRLEALLQQEKKLTQDYIEHLEEAVRQKSGIGTPMLNTLVQKEMAHWKAKAEGHSESTKTEMGLLRDWNVRIMDEKDRLEEEVKKLRQENGMLRVETEQLKGAKENEKGHDNDENKRLRIRNAQLEAEKDALNANMQMMLENSIALKTEIEQMEKGSVPEHKQEESDVKLKEPHNKTAVDNTSAPANTGKNHEKNAKRRARAKKRRDHVLVQENKQLSAKLAESDSQYATAHAAALAANEERLGKLQEKINQLQREIRSRDERAEQQRRTPVHISASAAAPTSASKRKAKKKKVKREQNKEGDMSE